jgi:hypothetical protein
VVALALAVALSLAALDDDDAAALVDEAAAGELAVEETEPPPEELQPVTANATANGTARKNFLFMICPLRSYDATHQE